MLVADVDLCTFSVPFISFYFIISKETGAQIDSWKSKISCRLYLQNVTVGKQVSRKSFTLFAFPHGCRFSSPSLECSFRVLLWCKYT